jgi:hypothetical protein
MTRVAVNDCLSASHFGVGTQIQVVWRSAATLDSLPGDWTCWTGEVTAATASAVTVDYVVEGDTFEGRIPVDAGYELAAFRRVQKAAPPLASMLRKRTRAEDVVVQAPVDPALRAMANAIQDSKARRPLVEIATCDGLRIPANTPQELVVLVPFLWLQRATTEDKTKVSQEWRAAWSVFRSTRVGVIVHLPYRQKFEALVQILSLAIFAPAPKGRDEWQALIWATMEILSLVTQITYGDAAAKKIGIWREKWASENTFDVVDLMSQIEALAPSLTGTAATTPATPSAPATTDLRALTAQIQTLATQVAEMKRNPFRRQ